MSVDAADPHASLIAWQAARRRALAAPDSWQGLVGLFWLEEGDNRLDASSDSPVSIPDLQVAGGTLRWDGAAVLWQPDDGAARTLATDRDGRPDLVRLGRHEFFIVERQGRVAARVRDLEWASRTPPLQLDYFPAAPQWRIEAEWRPLQPPRSMEVPNVSGELQVVEVDHAAVFSHDGQQVELLPMSVGEDGVFFVFRDRTSGRESYGAGRFLKVPLTVDGKIVLDFNYAYSPPCAFTPFATCPLPPQENEMPIAVRAGEKDYRGAH